MLGAATTQGTVLKDENHRARVSPVFSSHPGRGVQGQPGLQNKLQDRHQSYTGKPCLKKKKKSNLTSFAE